VLSEQRGWMQQRFAAKPDLTLRALLAELRGRGITVSYFGLWNIVKRSGLSFKKRPCMPASRIVQTLHADVSNGVAPKAG
jgi:transposase